MSYISAKETASENLLGLCVFMKLSMIHYNIKSIFLNQNTLT